MLVRRPVATIPAGPRPRPGRPRPAPPRHLDPCGAQPLAHGVVGDAEPAPDRREPLPLDLVAEHVERRALDTPAIPPARRRAACPAAVALLGTRGTEGHAARRARALVGLPPQVPPAVGVERRGAVRAEDPQVLEPVVVRDAVAVVQDQRQAPTPPLLALPALLAAARLQAPPRTGAPSRCCGSRASRPRAGPPAAAGPTSAGRGRRRRGRSGPMGCASARPTGGASAGRPPSDTCRAGASPLPTTWTPRSPLAPLPRVSGPTPLHEHTFAQRTDGTRIGEPGLEPGAESSKGSRVADYTTPQRPDMMTASEARRRSRPSTSRGLPRPRAHRQSRREQ